MLNVWVANSRFAGQRYTDVPAEEYQDVSTKVAVDTEERSDEVLSASRWRMARRQGIKMCHRAKHWTASRLTMGGIVKELSDGMMEFVQGSHDVSNASKNVDLGSLVGTGPYACECKKPQSVSGIDAGVCRSNKADASHHELPDATTEGDGGMHALGGEPYSYGRPGACMLPDPRSGVLEGVSVSRNVGPAGPSHFALVRGDLIIPNCQSGSAACPSCLVVSVVLFVLAVV